MAYGQVDPGRLQGEAPRQWYLRSPADIEQERQERAARGYEDFFANGDPGSPTMSPTQDGVANGGGARSSADQNAWRGENELQGSSTSSMFRIRFSRRHSRSAKARSESKSLRIPGVVPRVTALFRRRLRCRRLLSHFLGPASPCFAMGRHRRHPSLRSAIGNNVTCNSTLIH
jgi:hypothetical protein